MSQTRSWSISHPTWRYPIQSIPNPNPIHLRWRCLAPLAIKNIIIFFENTHGPFWKTFTCCSVNWYSEKNKEWRKQPWVDLSSYSVHRTHWAILGKAKIGNYQDVFTFLKTDNENPLIQLYNVQCTSLYDRKHSGMFSFQNTLFEWLGRKRLFNKSSQDWAAKNLYLV